MTVETIEITGRELVPAAPAAPATLYGTNEPRAILDHATAQANALARVVEQQRLYATISNRKHVLLEGWTTLGALVGVFAVPVWTRPVERDGEKVGWEARVEARTLAGAVVGAAEAECLRDEEQWHGRPDYALRSMAQTRAASKALRLPLGFIMTLAGYDATPADEMPVHQDRQPASVRPQNGQGRPQAAAPRPVYKQAGGGPAPVSDAQKNAIHRLLGGLKAKNPQLHDRVVGGAAIKWPDVIDDDGALVLTVLTRSDASAFMDLIGAALKDGRVADDADDLPFE